MPILLVEDEFLIRLIVAEELAESGFEVYEAESGDQAAALITEAPARFGLLVTDIHMPGNLDGIELARLMRARYPDIPIIYMTGRPGVLNALGPLGTNDALVAKPFTPSELLAVVQRLLAGGDNDSAG